MTNYYNRFVLKVTEDSATLYDHVAINHRKEFLLYHNNAISLFAKKKNTCIKMAKRQKVVEKVLKILPLSWNQFQFANRHQDRYFDDCKKIRDTMLDTLTIFGSSEERMDPKLNFPDFQSGMLQYAESLYGLSALSFRGNSTLLIYHMRKILR